MRQATAKAEKPFIEAHESGDTVWVDMFVVPPEERGKGVGARFYLDWEAKLPGSFKLVRLYAGDTGAGPSHGFWERMGFSYVFADEQGNENDNYMWKGIHGQPTPAAVKGDPGDDPGYDIVDKPEKTASLEEDPGLPDDDNDIYDDPARYFAHSACWLYALAVHRLTGLPMVSVSDPSEGVVHAAVERNGKLLDSKGQFSLAQIGKRYGLKRPFTLPLTEEGVEQIYGVDEHELARAEEFAREQLRKLGVKTAAKKDEPVKTLGFVIEVPRERRKTFFVRRKSPMEFWAFRNRPRVFVNEPLIFTFGGKPVAQAVAVKIEGPGGGEGEYKQWHKVYWRPASFRRFRAAALSPESASNGAWVSPDGREHPLEANEMHGQAALRLGFVTPEDFESGEGTHQELIDVAMERGYVRVVYRPGDILQFECWKLDQPTRHAIAEVAEGNPSSNILVETHAPKGDKWFGSGAEAADWLEGMTVTAGDRWLYHVTPEKNVERIMREGLKADEGYQLFENVPKATFFTTRKGLPFWKGEVEAYTGEPVAVVKVPRSELRLQIDEQGSGDADARAYKVVHDVPPGAIKLAAAEDWGDMVPGAEEDPYFSQRGPNVVPAPAEGERWYHGRRGPISFAPGRPAFFTRQREGAKWYSRERGEGKPGIGTFALDIKRPARHRDLDAAVRETGATDSDVFEHSQYSGENFVDYLYVPEVVEALKAKGFDGYVGWDVLENTEIEIAVPFGSGQIRRVASGDEEADRLWEESVASEGKGPENRGVWEGRRFWSGVADVADGSVIETHPYEEAERCDWHHSLYVSQPSQQMMREGAYAFFWIDKDGAVQVEWPTANKGEMTADLPSRIRSHIEVPAGKTATSRKFYHGTKKKNLDSILKDGLKVEFSEAHTEWGKAIYLACDDYTAANYEGMHGGGEPWVILEIDGRKLNEGHMRPDDYDFPDLWSEDHPDENWALQSWQTSLKVSCQIAYLADVPAGAIRVHPYRKTAGEEVPDTWWKHGYCWEYALAYQEAKGGDLYVATGWYADEDGEEAPEHAHAFVVRPGSKLGTDIKGTRPVKEILSECLFDHDVKRVTAEKMDRADFEQFLPNEDAVEEARKHISKTADHVSEEGFWAGEGNAASGVLPVCPSKGTVCLAWRSADVMEPNCWGTLGGAVKRGMSPQESAKEEMAEETGYSGSVALIPAFVFSSGGFKYHNFVGVVPSEFGFHPGEGHGWETDHIAWVAYDRLVGDMRENPDDYHPGLVKLFANSKDVIERALGAKKAAAKRDLLRFEPGFPENIRQFILTHRFPDESVACQREAYRWAEKLLDAVDDRHADFAVDDVEFRLGEYRGDEVGEEGHAWLVVEGYIFDPTGGQFAGTWDSGNYSAEEAEDADELRASFGKTAWKEISYEDEEGDLLGGILESDADLRAWAENEDIDDDKALLAKYMGMFKGKRVGVIDAMNAWDPGKGKGTEMLDRFLAEAAAKGCAAVVLESGNAPNEFDLYRWYERRGFSQFGKTPGDSLPLMVKWLKPRGKRAADYMDMRRPCPSGKRKFYDEVSAVGQHKKWDPGTPPLRAYVCPKCGWWHLTSRPQRMVAGGKRLYYHVSPVFNRSEIEKQGLVPQVKEFKHIPRPAGVYMFSSFEDAADWCYDYWHEFAAGMDEIDIWEIRIDPGKLRPDTHSQVEDGFYTTEPVPRGDIKLVDTLTEDGGLRMASKTAGFEAWMRPWLTGKCWEFAIALSHRMPGAEYVGLAYADSGVIHHVGLRKGGRYYDVRGETDEGGFNYGSDQGDEVVPLTWEEVMAGGEFGSWIGHEDEFNGTPEMVEAEKAVSRAFGNAKTASGVQEVVADSEFGSAEGYVADTDAEQLGNWLGRFNYDNPELVGDIRRYGRFAVLNNINVNEDARGQGHGDDLLYEFLDQAEALGADLCMLVADTAEEQQKGFDLIRWYERNDFEEVAEVSGGHLMVKIWGNPAARKSAAAHTPEYARRLIEALGQRVKEADFRAIGSVGAGGTSENDLDILVDIHPDAVFEDDRAWVETSGLAAAMASMGFEYLGPSDFGPEESAEKSEASGKYLDPEGSGIEKFFNPGTKHTVEFWFAESGMQKEADWRSKYLLPGALALGLAPGVAPGGFTPQQLRQEQAEEAEKAQQKQQRERVEQLIEAISRAEGADPDLNNPGNLVDFNTGRIKSFGTPEEGENALREQLLSMADGTHQFIKPTMTLREAGMIYSNGDPNWARNVSKIMHVPESITMQDLILGMQRASTALPSGRTGAVEWAKRAAGFAFKTFKKLWHVGTLDPKRKQQGSLEGAGLSVSVNPEEWRGIAQLGGDTWELTKPGNKFVNFHRISKQQRQQITKWGLENGYVEQKPVYRAVWFDDEDQEDRYMEFTRESEAKEQAEEMGGRTETASEGIVMTPKLADRTMHARWDDPVMAWDMLVTAYAEDELDCDGIWWDDTLDPHKLSAPRGVIFPGKLPSWKKRKAGSKSAADGLAFETQDAVAKEYEGQVPDKSFVMRLGGREIGAVGYLVLQDREGGTHWQIVDSYVMPEWRGKGYGRKMYLALFKDAKKSGVPYVISDEALSPDAEGLWESLKRDGIAEEEDYVYVAKTAAKPLPTFEQVADKGTDTNNEFEIDIWHGDNLANMREDYEAAVAKLKPLAFPLTVYRCFALREDEKIDFSQLGGSWSLSSRAAYLAAHEMHGDDEYESYPVIAGTVSGPAQVDWLNTVRAWMTLPNEEEIRLKPGAKVKVRGRTRTAAEWRKLPATDEWIDRAKAFLKGKWEERHRELGREGAPADLSGACKFASLFAQRLFGGRIVGNPQHQVVQLAAGRMLDFTDAYDPNTFYHDKEFWDNPEHRESMKSCEPRVNDWVDEFMHAWWRETFKERTGRKAAAGGDLDRLLELHDAIKEENRMARNLGPHQYRAAMERLIDEAEDLHKGLERYADNPRVAEALKQGKKYAVEAAKMLHDEDSPPEYATSWLDSAVMQYHSALFALGRGTREPAEGVFSEVSHERP